MTIRDATEADLAAILAIINEAIANTVSRWTETLETAESGRAWLAASAKRGLPILVVEDDGAVAGFGSLAPFRAFSGFRHTLEHALYIDPAAKRRGHGRAMLAELEVRARDAGGHVMVGVIASENAASLALHRAAGFIEVGRMSEVGRKFDRWLDLVLVQKML